PAGGYSNRSTEVVAVLLRRVNVRNPILLHRYKQARKRSSPSFRRTLRSCLCRSSTTDACGVPQATGRMPVPRRIRRCSGVGAICIAISGDHFHQNPGDVGGGIRLAQLAGGGGHLLSLLGIVKQWLNRGLELVGVF